MVFSWLVIGLSFPWNVKYLFFFVNCERTVSFSDRERWSRTPPPPHPPYNPLTRAIKVLDWIDFNFFYNSSHSTSKQQQLYLIRCLENPFLKLNLTVVYIILKWILYIFIIFLHPSPTIFSNTFLAISSVDARSAARPEVHTHLKIMKQNILQLVVIRIRSLVPEIK